ncbi:MAG: hypothetical protein IT210_11250 [Armatimonadetes bacterium]|nr:hypothetical protein [Armatimonadota bacterium]
MKEVSTSLLTANKRPGLSAKQERVTDNLEQLLNVLPPDIRQELEKQPDRDDLYEIVLDLGREPEARYSDRVLYMEERMVTPEDIRYVTERVGEFGDDNRAGIERTLHRISAIRNRRGKIVGLTCRIGRAVYGTIDIIRDVVETGKGILMLGRPGVGKCITGDSLVFSDRGMLPLRQFVPKNLPVDIFSECRATLHGKDGPVASSHVYNGGMQETVAITTAHGYRLEGTPEHPVVVLNEDSDLEFRQLKDIRTGDTAVIQRGQGMFGGETRLPKAAVSAGGAGYPREMSEALARFLGYIMAVGWSAGPEVMRLWHDETDALLDMASVTGDLFGLKLRRYYAAGHWSGQDFYIRSAELRAFLKGLGVELSPQRKRIPDCILKAPGEMAAAFFSSFFEAAAHLRKSRLELLVFSEAMARQMQVVLLNLGIVVRLRAKRNGRYRDRLFQITVAGRDLELLAERVGMVSERRSKYLTRMAQPAWNRQEEVIAHLHSRPLALKGAASGAVWREGLFSQPAQPRGERRPGHRALQTVLSLAEEKGNPIQAEMNRLKEGNLFYDAVAARETGRAEVFDFSVPVTHTFFASGFLNHNTTKLREVARVLSEEFKKRVVVVDTSNEIAGDGDIPHPAIGHARRMQVSTPSRQHEVMIEAVENHMPEVIVIDEIGTEEEAYAARTIAERGVQLVATAHGNSLENLLVNPTLSDLIGGIQAVTLSDDEAKRRGTQKTVLERKAPPTFEVVIEIMEMDKLAIHLDVMATVDKLLRGAPPRPEIRVHTPEGNIEIVQKPEPETRPSYTPAPRAEAESPPSQPLPATVRIFPYGVSRGRLDKAIKDLKVPAYIARDWEESDVIMTLKAHFRREPAKLKDAMDSDKAVFVVRSNTLVQIEECLRDIFQISDRSVEEMALRETEEAVERAIASQQAVELMPRNSYIRRLQHQLIEKYKLQSESVGQEPQRRVKVLPF